MTEDKNKPIPEIRPHTAGSVKLQKRDPAARSTTREKVCATCGQIFHLSPEQKFYDCPNCYQQKHPSRKPFHRQDTQLLVQIECAECGKQEFLNVQPQDPKAALCKACHGRKRREQRERLMQSKGKGTGP